MDASAVTEFLAAHQALLPFVATALAAAETTAFLSVLIPSTALLMAVGASVSTGALPFLPVWVGAAIGAIIGSSLSFWLGRAFGPRLLTLWPLRDHPDQVQRTRDAFARWGYGILILGHFIGPLRPVVFLFAGMSGLRVLPFAVVNTLGATAWAFVVPKTGELGGDVIGWFWQFMGL